MSTTEALPELPAPEVKSYQTDSTMRTIPAYTYSAGQMLDYARAALAAAAPSPVAIPEGWKLVPVEATPQMLDAAAGASMQHLLDCIADPKKARDIGSEENVRLTHASRYRTMIAAAPTAQPQPQPEPSQEFNRGWDAAIEAHRLPYGAERRQDHDWRPHELREEHGEVTLPFAEFKRLVAAQPEAPAEPSDKPLGYVKFRAAQTLQTDGYCDGHEWLEFCEPGEIGDDKKPAFAVYASPQAAPVAQQPTELTDEQIDACIPFYRSHDRKFLRAFARDCIKAQGGRQ